MTPQTADTAVRTAALKGSFRLTVGELRREADGVLSLVLKDPDGGALPAWEPGAHIDVLFPGGALRQYSLCSDPADGSVWRVAVLREQASRGGSRYVHEALQAGDVLEVRGPKNNFRGTPGSGEDLFIAGGIGITPLLPMIRAAHAGRRPWRLLYLGSSARSMAFLDEIAGFDPAGDRVRIHTKEEHGALNLAVYLNGAGLAGGTTVYACGPGRMLTELRSAHAAGTVPHLLFEDFGSDNPAGLAGEVAGSALADEVAGSALADGADAEKDAPFVVETADGMEVNVAEDETILDALQRLGVPALNSCRKGTCGTCETVVLGGIPDHRDEILSDEERATNETMLICVSRCRGGRLLLDL